MFMTGGNNTMEVKRKKSVVVEDIGYNPHTTREETIFKPLDPYTHYIFTHVFPQIMQMFILVKTRETNYLFRNKGIIKTRRILIRRKIFRSQMSWHDFFGPFLYLSPSSNSLSVILIFTHSGIRKARPKGIYWRQATRKDQLLLM